MTLIYIRVVPNENWQYFKIEILNNIMHSVRKRLISFQHRLPVLIPVQCQLTPSPCWEPVVKFAIKSRWLQV